MFIAKVVGTVVSTCKEKNLAGHKLMIVQDIQAPDLPAAQIAVDAVGAGVGEIVLVTVDGGAARQVIGSRDAPVNNAIIGILDYPAEWFGENGGMQSDGAQQKRAALYAAENGDRAGRAWGNRRRPKKA